MMKYRFLGMEEATTEKEMITFISKCLIESIDA